MSTNFEPGLLEAYGPQVRGLMLLEKQAIPLAAQRSLYNHAIRALTSQIFGHSQVANFRHNRQDVREGRLRFLNAAVSPEKTRVFRGAVHVHPPSVSAQPLAPAAAHESSAGLGLK